MIKNYSLIAQKWAHFFETPQGIQKIIEKHSSLQEVLDTLVAEVPLKFLSKNPPEWVSVLLIESFLAGWVLNALENNIDIFQENFKVSSAQGLPFCQWLDEKENFEKKVSLLDPVTQALLSQSASQQINKYFFVEKVSLEKPYREIIDYQNMFYFMALGGYFFASFVAPKK